MTDPKRILVIKHGALGDFILAMGPFAAIRTHHPDAHITLLTTKPYAELAERSGWFDAVWNDERPRWHAPGAWLALRRRLRKGRFGRVYDLQTSDRSSAYLRLFPRGARPEWSGIAPSASHPHANPDRDAMHTVERQKEQLAMAGIAEVPPPDLSWLDADLSAFALPDRFVLLVPGGAPTRPAKRWPAERYAELAASLAADGVTPVILGTAAEAEAAAVIAAHCPEALNLLGRTGFAEIAALARRAEAAIGNDTGPMHLIAAAGCPSLVLFSSESDPALCAPRGPMIRVLRKENLELLSQAEIRQAVEGIMRRTDGSAHRTSGSASG